MFRIICLGRFHNEVVALSLSTIATLFIVGCNSIESTMVTRDESNTTWQKHNCLTGVPITLTVPTHLRIRITHSHFFVLEPNGKGSSVTEVDMGVPVRNFDHKLIRTNKIFFVDFKRPPGGNSKTSVAMNQALADQQYFLQIKRTTEEQTITQVAGLLGKIRGKLNAPIIAGGEGGTGYDKIQEITSTVAYGVFEIDSPDFEERVQAFVDCHINKAHDAWVVHPDVPNIKRVGIPGDDNLAIPYPDSPFCNDECQLLPPGLERENIGFPDAAYGAQP